MPKLLIFAAFTLLICEKNVANYVLLRCKTCSLKIWPCKILEKYHVCCCHEDHNDNNNGNVDGTQVVKNYRCQFLWVPPLSSHILTQPSLQGRLRHNNEAGGKECCWWSSLCRPHGDNAMMMIRMKKFNRQYLALPLFGRGPNIRLWQYC